MPRTRMGRRTVSLVEQAAKLAALAEIAALRTGEQSQGEGRVLFSYLDREIEEALRPLQPPHQLPPPLTRSTHFRVSN